MNKMSKETEKLILDIYNITNQIYFIYNMLTRVEISGKINTKDYETFIHLLFLATEQEEALYLQLLENPEEINNISQFLINETSELDDSDNIDLILIQNPIDLIKSRISYRFNNLVLSNCFFTDDKDDTYSQRAEIQRVVHKTTSVRMASYLEDAINFTSNTTVKNSLITARLSLSFLDAYLEEQYLNTGFSKVPNIFDQEMQDIFGINPELSESLKESHGVKIILRATSELFDYEEEDFQDPLMYTESLVLIGLVQTSILYLSDSDLKEIKIELYNTLEEYKLDGIYTDKSYLENVFDTIFSSTQNIRKKASLDLSGSKEY